MSYKTIVDLNIKIQKDVVVDKPVGSEINKVY
jgi:hypothetical protein